MKDWDCLGPAPGHQVDLERVETPRPSFTSEIAIERCRTCGQLYRLQMSEINDWSGGRDYFDETRIWTALDEDEIEIVRRDFNYRPRSDKSYRHDTGWL